MVANCLVNLKKVVHFMYKSGKFVLTSLNDSLTKNLIFVLRGFSQPFNSHAQKQNLSNHHGLSVVVKLGMYKRYSHNLFNI